jgi:hypothetical protein
MTRRDAGEPLVEIARSYAVSHSTISFHGCRDSNCPRHHSHAALHHEKPVAGWSAPSLLEQNDPIERARHIRRKASTLGAMMRSSAFRPCQIDLPDSGRPF